MTEQEITYTVFKRPVKQARLEYNRGGLRIIVPSHRTIDIEAFIAKFRPWIIKKRKFYENLSEQSKSLDLVVRTEAMLLEILKEYLTEAESVMNVKAVEVRLRAMKRQWGNCTNRGRITFNKRLQKLPEHLVRYIVYHEACHLKSLRHGKLFHKTMLNFFPQLKLFEKELSVYGFRLGIEE